uniref:Uncharacterized protein LOC116940255 isoform X1 n=2 Tax=Petromyzon marinus TaxID=7757 RepID=A0AAJ7SU42_PETMA|nr:uncharacterized protein LOC116940255 isoform X1 [Petromyzon marinus]
MWNKVRQSYQLHGSSVKDKERTTENVTLKKITEFNQSLSETSTNRRRQMGNSASIHNDSPIKQLSGSGSQSSGIATDESGTMDSSPLNSDAELSTPEISQKSQEPPVNSGKDNSAIQNHFPLNCCWDAGSPRASLVGADILKVDDDDAGGGGGTLQSPALKQDDPLDKEGNGKILSKNMSRDSGLVPSDNEKSPCSPHKPLNGRSASLDSGNALTPTRTLNAGLPQWPSSPPSKMIQGKSKSCFDLGCNLRKSDLALSPTNVQFAGLTKSCSSVHATSLAVLPKDTIIPAISDNDVHGKHHSDQSLALSAKSGVVSASMFHNCSRTAVSTNSVLPPSQAKCPPRSMSSQALNVNGSTVACKPRELHQHTLPRTHPRTSNHLLLCGRPLNSEVSEKSSTPDIHNRNLTNTSSNCTETSPTLVEGCPDALPKEPACPPVTTASNMSSKHLIMEALNRATLRHCSTASLVTSSTKVDDCPSSPTHQEHKPDGEQGGCCDITNGKVASLADYNPSNDIIQDAAVPPKQESVALQQRGPLPRVMDDPVDVVAPTGTSKEKTMEKQPSEVLQDNYEAIIQDWEEYLQNALPQTNQDVTDNSAKQPCEQAAAAAAAGTGFVQLLEMVRFLECISRVYDERARSGDFRAQQLAGQAVPGTKKATELAHTKVFGAQDPQNRIAKMKTLPMAQELVSGLSRATVARDDSTQCQQQQQQANAVAAGAIPKRRHHTLWPASAKRHSDPNLRPLHLEPSYAGMQPDDCIDGAMTLNRHHSRAPWKSLRALFKRSKAVKQSHSGDSTYSRSEEVDDIKETEEFSGS